MSSLRHKPPPTTTKQHRWSPSTTPHAAKNHHRTSLKQARPLQRPPAWSPSIRGRRPGVHPAQSTTGPLRSGPEEHCSPNLNIPQGLSAPIARRTRAPASCRRQRSSRPREHCRRPQRRPTAQLPLSAPGHPPPPPPQLLCTARAPPRRPQERAPPPPARGRRPGVRAPPRCDRRIPALLWGTGPAATAARAGGSGGREEEQGGSDGRRR
jgi:hypothetical protein